MTTSSPTTAASDLLTLERPDGVSDVRWEMLQQAAHKVVTGHYPWCSDHQSESEADEGWCMHEDMSRIACIRIQNSTLDGHVYVDFWPAEGMQFDDLGPSEASLLAHQLERASLQAREIDPAGRSEVKA